MCQCVEGLITFVLVPIEGYRQGKSSMRNDCIKQHMDAKNAHETLVRMRSV